MAARIDLTGQRFGNLLVKEYAYTKHTFAYWRVQCLLCDCIVEVSSSNLQSGNTTACTGCNVIGLTREIRDEIVKRVEVNKEKKGLVAKDLGITRGKLNSVLKKMKKGRDEAAKTTTK